MSHGTNLPVLNCSPHSIGTGILDECCNFWRVLRGRVLDVVEISNRWISICGTFSCTGFDVRTGSDELSQKDEGGVQ